MLVCYREFHNAIAATPNTDVLKTFTQTIPLNCPYVKTPSASLRSRRAGRWRGVPLKQLKFVYHSMGPLVPTTMLLNIAAGMGLL